MMRVYPGILIIISVLITFAQQTTDYVIVEAPIGVMSSDTLIWVKWTGTSRSGLLSPDSGTIYFSKSPGGGKIANYKDSINFIEADSLNNKYFPPSYTSNFPCRGVAFKAKNQEKMGSGVFYSVVAYKGKTDTLVSNEFQIIIESPNAVKIISPTATTSSLTPTFQWMPNSGVPYYHIILSDDKIDIKSEEDGDKIDIQGLSIVWQAITPNTQIVYGAPDPSGTITADPPPLSPGQQYSWFVLNNYGNHLAFSSQRFDIPGSFTISGTSLKKPVCIYPKSDSLSSDKDSIIRFKWTNLDVKSNTYKLYVYSTQSYEELKAQVIVWQTEVMAVNASETMSVDVNAKSIFATNNYSWRIIATDEKGAGTSSDTVGFRYEVPTGKLVIKTMKKISSDDGSGVKTTNSNVGLVKIQVEVLDGPMEAPLFFYTDLDGYVSRDRPTGTYRITAIKNEFENQVQTVVVSRNITTNVTFILTRPEATIYGKVVDESRKGINLAFITGVSDIGDSLSTQTDALGNFVFKCYGADWSIAAQKTGYKSVLPEKVTVNSGENFKFDTILMYKNPITLSGTVKNTSGIPLLGVKVRLLNDGALIEEIPATSQNGTFSFSIQPGSYTITATKTGFTSYQGKFDVVNSKSINITLQPGASLVSGYVYGKKWVGEREIIAPVTNATVKFINISSLDTFTCITDATYGDYKVSLQGNQKFTIVSTANGYAFKDVPCTVSTQLKTTQTYNDTIQSFGLVTGTVYCSSPSNVIISLKKVFSTDNPITGKTLTNGSFEVRNIVDGKYTINVGKDGFVLDSIAGSDTIVVSGGRSNPSQTAIYLKPGTKTIKWNISPENFTGTIKLQLPLQKTINSTDSLKGAGTGIYVINVDAKNDSFIDLSYHQFSVKDDDLIYTDNVKMNVMHSKIDTLFPDNGKVILLLRAEEKLDSAAVFYKDASGSNYRKNTIIQQDSIFKFNIEPPRDGSTMLYYFKAWRKTDVFGYDKENYRVYVAPDSSRLTRIEIEPYNEDTLVLPSSYPLQFTLKGYYSSAFIPFTKLNGQAVSWRITDPQGCTIDRTNGLDVTVTTGKNRAFAIPVTLTATIDTTKIKVTGNNSVSVVFRISGSKIANLNVKRIDAGNPNPVKASGIDKVEFSATGTDQAGALIDIVPKWSILPENAGVISSDGIFLPDKNFCGSVRIFAEAVGIRDEYCIDGSERPGVKVQYMITHKNTADTASNENGCTVVFPSGIVSRGEIGLLSIETQILNNKIRRGTGLMKTIDSTAFLITETEGVTFEKLENDSINLVLSVPEVIQKEISNGSRDAAIACWNEDSLKWDPLVNSRIADNGKTISAALTHFSVYSIVIGPSRGGYMNVTPNPFSPYVWPKTVSPEEKRFGTCISFKVETDEPPLKDVKLRIFTITGEPIWSMQIQNANQFPYQLWWDGRTLEREMVWTQPGNIICVKGNKMCRNGRYFAVLSAKDSKNKEQRFMKQIVLMR